MRSILKSSSKTFNSHIIDLTNVLYGYRHFNSEIKKCFEKLGYTIVSSGNHMKCYYNNRLVTTIASTPSDSNAGHEILRCIRLFWESYEKNN